jgi:hypothetical protein
VTGIKNDLASTVIGGIPLATVVIAFLRSGFSGSENKEKN